MGSEDEIRNQVFNILAEVQAKRVCGTSASQAINIGSQSEESGEDIGIVQGLAPITPLKKPGSFKVSSNRVVL